MRANAGQLSFEVIKSICERGWRLLRAFCLDLWHGTNGNISLCLLCSKIEDSCEQLNARYLDEKPILQGVRDSVTCKQDLRVAVKLPAS